MQKTAFSPRIQAIEHRFGQPIQKLFYDWHIRQNAMHKDIAAFLNLPRPTITRWFKYFRIPTQPCFRFTNLNLLNTGYVQGPRAKPKVKKVRPWKVNENFFNTWGHKMAYVLGFFCADGCMFKNPRGSCYIAFNITDKDLLIKMKDLLGVGHKLSLKKRLNPKAHWKPSWSIQIGSKKMFNQLLRLGVTPRKFSCIRIPKMPKKYKADFIRGYFDGDGHVCSGYCKKKDRKTPTRILITGFTSCSKGMLRDIAVTLHRLAGTHLKKVSHASNAFRLYYSVRDSLKIYNFLYQGNPLLFLERKKVRFERFMGP